MTMLAVFAETDISHLGITKGDLINLSPFDGFLEDGIYGVQLGQEMFFTRCSTSSDGSHVILDRNGSEVVITNDMDYRILGKARVVSGPRGPNVISLLSERRKRRKL